GEAWRRVVRLFIGSMSMRLLVHTNIQKSRRPGRRPVTPEVAKDLRTLDGLTGITNWLFSYNANDQIDGCPRRTLPYSYDAAGSTTLCPDVRLGPLGSHRARLSPIGSAELPGTLSGHEYPAHRADLMESLNLIGLRL